MADSCHPAPTISSTFHQNQFIQPKLQKKTSNDTTHLLHSQKTDFPLHLLKIEKCSNLQNITT